MGSFSALLTADLHLTANPKDRYRWRIFRFLVDQAIKYGPDLIVLGGDITDNKDEHPSWLVNRVVEWVRELAKYCQVVWIRGNHDYIDANLPFFQFLDGEPNIVFVTQPYEWVFRSAHANPVNCLFLPNTRTWEQDWPKLEFGKFDYIFCHQSFDGCVSENGTRLEGIPPSVFKGSKARVYSGDIHKPQKVGKQIEYVGAPYHVRFGDDFSPRVLVLGRDPKGNHQQQDLPTDMMQKHVVDIQDRDPVEYFVKWLKDESFGVVENDQVKVRVHMLRSELIGWAKIRDEIKAISAEHKLMLFGPEVHVLDEPQKQSQGDKRGPGRGDPIKVLESYAEKQGLSKAMTKAGKAFLGQG